MSGPRILDASGADAGVEDHRIVCEQLRHNRNPFIDHPEWGQAIWENLLIAAVPLRMLAPIRIQPFSRWDQLLGMLSPGAAPVVRTA